MSKESYKARQEMGTNKVGDGEDHDKGYRGHISFWTWSIQELSDMWYAYTIVSKEITSTWQKKKESLAAEIEKLQNKCRTHQEDFLADYEVAFTRILQQLASVLERNFVGAYVRLDQIHLMSELSMRESK